MNIFLKIYFKFIPQVQLSIFYNFFFKDQVLHVAKLCFLKFQTVEKLFFSFLCKFYYSPENTIDIRKP